MIVPAAGAAPQEQDPALDELMQGFKLEFADVKVGLADPETREDAIAQYHAATERLLEVTRTMAAGVISKATELGTSAEYTPELEERLEYLRLAACAALLAGEQDAALDRLRTRALALAAAGRRKEACAALEAALEFLPDADAIRAHALFDLAEQRRRTRDFAGALEDLDELETMLAGSGKLAAFAESIAEARDFTYLDMGMPDRAREGIERRLAEAEERWSRGAGNEKEMRSRRGDLVRLRYSQGDDGLPALLDGLLADGSVAPTPEHRAFLLRLRGAAELTARGKGDPERAREFLTKALELPNSATDAIFLHQQLAEAALRLGRLDEAEAELARAAGIAKELGLEKDDEQVTREARLALERKADRATLEAVRTRLDAAFAEMLASWRGAAEREESLSYLQYGGRRDVIGEYARVAIALDGEAEGAADAFERVLAAHAAGTLARRHAAPEVDLATVRAELLGPGHGLLVYLPASSRSHVFVLDDAELVHVELPVQDDIERLRVDYVELLAGAREHLEDPARRERFVAREREAARALSAALLPPAVAERVARWERVTVSGLDVLGPLPFEWLPLGDAAHVGAVRELASLPSLPLGVAWSRRPQRAFERDYLLVGGAPHDERAASRGLDPVPLDGVAEELCAPFASAATLIGPRATRTELARSRPGDTRVVQIVTHGIGEPERERSQALLFSASGDDDGILRQEDVAALSAPGLVLLTSCKTGAGPVRKGNPLIADLGGAFLAAGADAVVVTHTDLQLSDVRAFSAAFGPELAAGATSAAALRAARAALVEQHGAAAPLRMGMIELVGLGHRPLFAAGAPRAGVGAATSGGGAAPWLGGAALGAGAALLLTRGMRARSTARASA